MTTLPATTVDVEQMITAATEGYVVIRERMGADYSREWLETTLKEFLRKGLIETLKVIEAADNGDEIAHRALVSVFAEMQTPTAQLKAYVERTALRGPPTRKPGRYGPYDNWRRDLGLVVLVYWVAAQFDLNPTRQLESRHTRPHSGASVTVTALRRKGFNISEKRLNNLWSDLGGAVVSFATTQQTPFPSIMPS
jgi:hypothetical protein